jgi:hypothetical protein
MLDLVAVAAISLTLDLSRVFQQKQPATPPAVTCGIKTVSYRFTGQPGREFRYDGETFRVPASGSIELIASRASEYAVGGRKLPLDVWPIDEFGARTVQLP